MYLFGAQASTGSLPAPDCPQVEKEGEDVPGSWPTLTVTLLLSAARLTAGIPDPQTMDQYRSWPVRTRAAQQVRGGRAGE